MVVALFPDTTADSEELFKKKIEELIEEYTILPEGEDTLEAFTGTGYERFDVDESVLDRNKGLLFIDIHDYDHDGRDELLAFRRERLPSTNHAGLKQERSGFVAEMYEVIEGECKLADTMNFGVYDTLYFAFGSSGTTVFRRDTADETVLYVHAFVSEMDHGPDHSTVCVRYQDQAFSDFRGARIGHWYDETSNGIYFTPASEEAAMELSIWSNMEGNSGAWDIVERPVAGDNSRPLAAYEKGMEEIGLRLLWSPLDFNSSDEAPYRMSALQCFAPVAGELTELGRYFVYHGDHEDESTMEFHRGWIDTHNSLVPFRSAEAENTDAGATAEAAGMTPAEPAAPPAAEPEPTEAEELTLESLDIPYGHYEGYKPQGEGAIPTELDLYEDGTFRLHCVFELFDMGEPEDENYEYTYTGTYTVDRLDDNGNPVLAMSCDVTDFEITWDGEGFQGDNFSVFYEDYF